MMQQQEVIEIDDSDEEMNDASEVDKANDGDGNNEDNAADEEEDDGIRILKALQSVERSGIYSSSFTLTYMNNIFLFLLTQSTTRPASIISNSICSFIIILSQFM